MRNKLLLLPQRYKFSSKSQQLIEYQNAITGCCCYRKGTNFQANHNCLLCFLLNVMVVVATAKVQIFKQITTARCVASILSCCCCYRKGTNFQANHNPLQGRCRQSPVVVATAKVQIFKQITTSVREYIRPYVLLLLPQRYKFSSKSQQSALVLLHRHGCCCYRKGTNFQANHNSGLAMPNVSYSCCCYRKGTNFQANHNQTALTYCQAQVVVATAKVQIFKQITTRRHLHTVRHKLLLLPQRYKFSSKSQLHSISLNSPSSCCCYRKGTNFQANHNGIQLRRRFHLLLLLPQRYKFSSKSQPVFQLPIIIFSCCCYRKGTNFQANHNLSRRL